MMLTEQEARGKIADLIARLEKASGPSRELDCLIGVAIGRFEAQQGYGVDRTDYVELRPDGSTVRPGHGGDQLVPHYTGSFDAAIRLVPDDYDWIVGSVNGHMGGTPYACVGDLKEHHADTPIIALCIAALKARSAA